ncbi:MAG: HAD family hydrolase [Promethearchaeota archaeon]
MKIKGVFFDLFGTLFIYRDFDSAWRDWRNSLYNNFVSRGMKIGEIKFDIYCEKLFNSINSQNLYKTNTKLTFYEQNIQNLIELIGISINEDTIRKIAINSIYAWANHLILDSDTIPILEEIKDQKILGLITNFDHPPFVYNLLKKYKLISYFDTIVISGEFGVNKPDPRIFHEALKKTGIKSNEAIYIGDSIEFDVKGAISSGFKSFLIDRNENLQIQSGLNYIPISKLSQISEIIKENSKYLL